MATVLRHNKAAAVEAGFASYSTGSDCPHLCIDIPDGGFTISCKNSQGEKITFAFAPKCGPKEIAPGHHCVDVVHHNHLGRTGIPVQKAILFGQGPTIARSDWDDEVPVTVVSVCM